MLVKVSFSKSFIIILVSGIFLFLSSLNDFSLEDNLKKLEFEEDELVEDSKLSNIGPKANLLGGNDFLSSLSKSEFRHLISWSHANIIISYRPWISFLSIGLYLHYCCLKIAF